MSLVIDVAIARVLRQFEVAPEDIEWDRLVLEERPATISKVIADFPRAPAGPTVNTRKILLPKSQPESSNDWLKRFLSSERREVRYRGSLVALLDFEYHRKRATIQYLDVRHRQFGPKYHVPVKTNPRARSDWDFAGSSELRTTARSFKRS